MFILGIILTVLGVGSAIYGVTQNNDMEAQVTSLFNSGSVNPGTVFIIIGAIAAVIGIILMVVGRKKTA